MADYQNLLQQIDSAIQREFDTLSAPGLAIGITDSRATLSVKTYGLASLNASVPLTPLALFQIGSISKAFTSVVLLQLSEEGLIDLHAPLASYLPWFEINSCHPPITLYHLMSHTAGIITGSEAHPSPFLEVWSLRHTRAAAPPGETFHYSNAGYKALGLVLEAVLGQSLEAILRQRVLDPLGMSETEPVITNQIRSRMAVGHQPFFDDRPLPRGGPLAPAPWFESDTADGSISSNAGDMCRYLRFLLNGGEGLISPESFQQLIAPVIPTADKLHGEHYGLGLFSCQIDGHRVIGHSGGMVGYSADLLADLDADLGLVALASGPGDPQKITRFMLQALRSAQEEERPLPEFGPDQGKHPAEDYAGSYECGGRELRLVSRAGKLYLDDGGGKVSLEYREPDLYLAPHRDYELYPLRFGREASPDGDGKNPVVEIFHGPNHFLRSGCQSERTSQILEEWEAYTGHYRAYNPWLSNFRIVAQKDSLVLIQQVDGEMLPLHQTGPGEFRLGPQPASPELIHFDLILNGKAMRANLSGCVYGRTFTD